MIPLAGASIHPPLAFAPDGNLLAITPDLKRVRLVDPRTREEVATLTPPDQQVISWLCFSPDGSQLAAATEGHLIHLWDLRTIRRQLAEMKLDWDRVRYPWAKESEPPKPLRVSVLGGVGGGTP
jgi:WD40 repeat protein